MNDEIDRIRKENGWKPRKRGKPGRRGRGSGSSNGGETPNNTAAADEHVKLLQKLQVSAKNIYSGSSNGGEAPNNSGAADEHVKLLQKLQVSAKNISSGSSRRRGAQQQRSRRWARHAAPEASGER